MLRLLSLSFCVIAAFMVGCAQGKRTAPDGLLPVTGRVTIDGKPASHVTLTFLPEKGTNGLGGYAVTDEEGKFSVKHLSNAKGAEGLEQGTYDIVFSKLTMQDGSPIPEGKTAADVGAVESLPPKFSKLNADSPLYSLRVDGAKSDVEFGLKTKK